MFGFSSYWSNRLTRIPTTCTLMLHDNSAVVHCHFLRPHKTVHTQLLFHSSKGINHHLSLINQSLTHSQYIPPSIGQIAVVLDRTELIHGFADRDFYSRS